MSTNTSDFEYGSRTPPDSALFVAADEPLLAFPSIRAAEDSLEAIDVKNGVYPAAYGPNGELFSVGSERNRVIIKRPGEPNRPDELKALLLRYLEASGRPADASLSYRELVATVWLIECDFWFAHEPYGERFGTRIPVWGCVTLAIFAALGLYVAFR